MSRSKNTRPFRLDFPDGWDGDGQFPEFRLMRPRIVSETLRRQRRNMRHAARAAIRNGQWDTLTSEPRSSVYFPGCHDVVRT